MKALLIAPIFLASLVFVFRLLEINTKRNTIAGPVRENLTLRLFMATGTFMFLGSILELLWRQQVNFLAVALGVACAIASFVIRRKAIKALGKFWSLHVEIRDTHEFVKSGPFKWVRHPTYFSMILELLSLGLILNAWIMLLIIPFCYFPVLLMRVRLEEAALIEKFGEDYRQYRQTTPAIIPWKLPR